MVDRSTLRRTRAGLVGLGVAVVVASIGAVVVVNHDDPAPTLVVADATLALRGTGDATAIAPEPVPEVQGFVAAEAVVPMVTARVAPEATAAEVATLANPTWEGFPLTFVVLGERAGWSEVRLLMRPNGSTGWVPSSDLRSYEVPNRVVVEQAARRITVYRGDSAEVLFATDAGVGSGRTPTPLGEFWIDIVNPLDGNGVYGWGQLSVAGFSDVHQTFGGGIGQIAIHGTNNPASVGGDVSNGCVRLRNDDMATLATMVNVGTPVSIVA